MMIEIIKKLKLLYDVEKICNLRQIGGFSALNYEVKIDDKIFILKRYRSQKKSTILRIEKITKFLNEQNFPVELPLLSLRKDYHVMMNGYFFALFPKTEGYVINEPQLSNQVLCTIAAFIAKFHRVNPTPLKLKKSKEISSMKRILQESKRLLLLIKQKRIGLKEDSLTMQLVNEKLDFLKTIPRTFLKRYNEQKDFVHGDFHNENILFDENLNIVRLLDFEETHLGHRVEDIMHFILLACCNSGYEKSNLKKARFFMQSYVDLLPLTEEEIIFGVYKELFKEMRSFFIERMLYQTHNLFLLNLIKRDLKKIEFFKKNRDAFISNLLI